MRKATRSKAPVKASALPVTREMVYRVRDSLSSDIRSAKLETRAIRIELGSEIRSARQETKALRAELTSETKTLRTEINAKFASVEAQIHRLHLLLEEQNAKNNYVMDGLINLFHRQERLEKGRS